MSIIVNNPGGGSGVLQSLIVDLAASDIFVANNVPYFTIVLPLSNQIVIPVSVAFLFTQGSDPYQGFTSIECGYFVSGTFYDPLALGPLSSALGGSITLSVLDPSNALFNQNMAGKPFVLKTAVGGGPIVTFSVSVGGSGYAPGDTGSIDSGNADALYAVDTVDGGGAVLTFHLDANGTGYVVGPNDPTTPFDGAGDAQFAVSIDSITPGNGTAQLELLYYLVPA